MRFTIILFYSPDCYIDTKAFKRSLEWLIMNKDIRTFLVDISQNDMHAFGMLYDLLARRVLNYVYVITKNKQMSEDITHDVFLQVYQKAIKIEKAPDPVAYIMVIARNYSFNAIKRESRLTALEDCSITNTASASQYDKLLFEEAFNILPANQRETIYLHLICGYRHKDIATIQNVPLVTVKWRYRQAVSKLKEYFTQNEMGVNCNERI